MGLTPLEQWHRWRTTEQVVTDNQTGKSYQWFFGALFERMGVNVCVRVSEREAKDLFRSFTNGHVSFS